VFYLAYHLYRSYFPLLALTTYKRMMEREAAVGVSGKG
jgi:squalene-hopene/tetraprenyl-beta-curcumene cyclase